MDDKKSVISGLVEDAITGLGLDFDEEPVNKAGVFDRGFGVVSSSDKRGAVGSVGEGDERDNNGGNVVAGNGAKMEEEPVRWFSELTNDDVLIAGGKGASLGEMYQNKFPVPPGFVVSAKSFNYFISKNGIKERIYEILEGLDRDDTEELHKASKEIRELIEKQEMPKDLEEEILESYKILGSEKVDERGVSATALQILKNAQEPIFVSVRSSATTEDLVDASFAGQQESFLNVKGDASLIDHVKRCFSSLYTPRAIFYRSKKGFSEREALLAVVVQKMIDSEKSGVVFSKNPIRSDESIAIEAVFGLGEGIVSGRIKPDNYVVSNDLKIEDVKVADKKIAVVRAASGENGIAKLNRERSNQQVLTNGEILEVADFAQKLEKHYGKPQDIEFAVEMNKVYILQSRPITTVHKEQEEGEELSGNVLLEGLGASPGVGIGVVRIIKEMGDLEKIKKGDVLVTEMTNPDMVVGMQKSVAIVTDEGGLTSHASIVSREMGIPCIVGTGEATAKLKEGMKITVDGRSGRVYEGEVGESSVAEVKEAVKTDKVNLKVIVDLPEFAERAARSGVEGVGLMRLEGVIASFSKHPLYYEKNGTLEEYSGLLAEGIGKIIKHFRKMWIRASDIRTDEFSSLEGSPEREINPMLGFHGVRFSLKHPDILKAELMAIRKVAELNPEKKIGIMFPQIISIEEVRKCKEYFDEIKTDNMEFGVMIETPASVQIIDEICDEVEFISFGTNDLTQFTLAVDRGEDNVQYLYNELHPAIFSQIKKVIEACKKKNVETSICGQAGSKKEMVKFLVNAGIDSISVNADAAHDIAILINELVGEVVEVEKVDEGVEGEVVGGVEKVDEGIEGRSEVEVDGGLGVDEGVEVGVDGGLGVDGVVGGGGLVAEDKIGVKVDGGVENKGEVNEEAEVDEVAKEEVKVEEKEGEVVEKLGEEENNQEFSKEMEEVRKEVAPKEGEQVLEIEVEEVGKVERVGELDIDELKREKKRLKNRERRNKKKEKMRRLKAEGKWSKKGGMDLEFGKNVKDDKNIELERSSEEIVVEEKSDQNLLDSGKIEFKAERSGIDKEDLEPNIGPIEPFNDLSRVKREGEEIQERVEEDNEDKIEENERAEDKIETNVEEVSLEEEKEDKVMEELGDVLDRSGGKDFEGDVKESGEERVKEDIKEISDSLDEGKDKESVEVYKPEVKEEREEKKEYKYDFDDF
tara:strand:+ start:2550 stop:6167 length:3618 start_codon:yes stop_codon:yes gene_type:complete